MLAAYILLVRFKVIYWNFLMNIQHSSRSNEWYTPEWVLNLVHLTIGYPELDPASCEFDNRTVKANRYITEDKNALKTVWTEKPCSIYLNPPGGKLSNRSLTALFWDELMHYWEQGLVTEAIFMAFSAEALQNTQVYPRKPIGDFVFCIPKQRIKFVSPNGDFNAPSHSNCIVYIPGTVDNTELFYENFFSVGSISIPFKR